MKISEVNYEKIITLILIAVTAFLPLLYLLYTKEACLYPNKFINNFLICVDNINKAKIYGVFYLVLIMAVIMALKSRYKKKSFSADLNNISVTLFLIFTILSTFFSDHFLRSLFGNPNRWEGLFTYISYVLIFVAAGYFIDKRKFLKSIIKYLFISASILSVYGLLQFYGLDFINRKPDRAFATFGNPNFAASYIAIVLSLSLVLYIYSQKKQQVYKYGFFSSLFFAFLVATSTRSALVGFLVSISVFVLYFHDYLRKNLKRLIIIILIFIIILGVIDFHQELFYTNRVISLFVEVKTLTDAEQEQTYIKVGSGRLAIYRYSLPLLWENPIFGSGPDTFDIVFPHIKYSMSRNSEKFIIVDKAHNEYLQIGITLGLPALLFYLLLLANIYKNGFKALKKLKNQVSELNIYHTALFMAVITYTVTALFNISVVSVAPIFWAVLGLNIAAYKMGV